VDDEGEAGEDEILGDAVVAGQKALVPVYHSLFTVHA
jgi:hypothetical protein